MDLHPASVSQDDFVDIPDSFQGHDKSHFCIPSHYSDSISSVLIPHGLIQERLKKMARDILKDILDENAEAVDPTRNICLDAEGLILTKEEEEKTILDLLSDDTLDDLLNISEPTILNMNMNTNIVSDRVSMIDEPEHFPHPTIHVKSFARQFPKKEKLHFLCITKAGSSQLEMLRRLRCPSVKGGYKFFLDLLDHVNKFNASRSKTSVQVSVDFIKVECVRDTVMIEGIDNVDTITDSNVVIVEDVVDTGRMMSRLVSKLEEFSPKRILIACLLRKRCNVQCYRPHYTGFQVPNKMLVGYALDYNEYFRDLSHICILNSHGLNKYCV